jgi:hypothetical protein
MDHTVCMIPIPLTASCKEGSTVIEVLNALNILSIAAPNTTHIPPNKAVFHIEPTRLPAEILIAPVVF